MSEENKIMSGVVKEKRHDDGSQLTNFWKGGVVAEEQRDETCEVFIAGSILKSTRD